MSHTEARDEIINQKGQQFDPQVVEAFLDAWEEINSFAGKSDKIIDLDEQIINIE